MSFMPCLSSVLFLSLRAQALAINQKYLSPASSGCILCCNNIAAVHDRMGNLPQAALYYERARQGLCAENVPRDERSVVSRRRRQELLRHVQSKLDKIPRSNAPKIGAGVDAASLRQLIRSAWDDAQARNNKHARSRVRSIYVLAHAHTRARARARARVRARTQTCTRTRAHANVCARTHAERAWAHADAPTKARTARSAPRHAHTHPQTRRSVQTRAHTLTRTSVRARAHASAQPRKGALEHARSRTRAHSQLRTSALALAIHAQSRVPSPVRAHVCGYVSTHVRTHEYARPLPHGHERVYTGRR
eukprot:6202395-Pleurochrysis_carterae.AAC.1